MGVWGARRVPPKIDMAWSLLVRNGWVIDGSGAPRVQADVAVEGDRIAAIGPGLAGEATRTIDATRRIVAPGFIDAHSHSDLFYFGCPSSESKVRQGCTTEVVGMCSFSQAPVAPGRADLVRAWVEALGPAAAVRWGGWTHYLPHLPARRPAL